MTGSTKAESDGSTEAKTTVSTGVDTTEPLDVSEKDTRENGMTSAVGDYIDDLIEATESARSSEVFCEFLDAQSLFHSYSFRNSLLIQMQHPGARRVAGYCTWQDDFDRQVQKGEEGIYIWRPIFAPKCPACGNSSNYHDRSNCEYDETPSEEWGKGLVGFTTTTVFALDQTEGEPVPTLPSEAVADGTEAPLDAFLGAQDEIGVSAEVVHPDAWLHPGTGVCHLADGSVEALGDRPDAAIVGTLAHEYGHALLHAATAEADGETETEAQEIETEAVAYVVGRHFGLDMDGSAFYLASWSDDEPSELRDRLKRISTVSKRIIEAVEAELDD